VSGLACRAKGAPLLDPPTEGSPRFDCQGGADAWQVAWSVEQQHWCCQHERAGCPDTDEDLQGTAPPGQSKGIAEGATRIGNVPPITDCADSADDTDYYTGRPLPQVGQVAKGPDCRAKCEANPKCGAWTWGKNPGVKGLEGVCFLKALAPGQRPRPDAKRGVVSGIPCRDAGSGPRAGSGTTTPGADASEAVAPMRPGAGSNCGEVEESMDYQTSTSLRQVSNVATPEKCIQECERNHKCGAWTWGAARGQFGLTDVCFLKGVKAGETPHRHSKEGVVSGVPCHTSQWLKQGLVAKNARRATLFCFALMLPHTYEQQLLAMQYRLGASLFGCDAHTIYSNMSIVVAGDVVTHVVDSNLKCSMGGEFGTALNTEIFLQVWKVVASDTTYMSCDWTAKVDPDAVFLPERLRVALQGHAERPEGVYLNNCWRGMHGPVEVFSRNAVTAWLQGTQRCLKHFNKLCSGPCQWGEDMFVDQCLEKVLQVRRDNDYAVLIEDHCDPPSNWQSCEDEGTVAFHPFKKQNEYLTCLQTADPTRVLTTTITSTSITQTVTTTFTTPTEALVVPSYQSQADGAGSQSGLLEDDWPTPSPTGSNTFQSGGNGLLNTEASASSESPEDSTGESTMPTLETSPTSPASVSREPSTIVWGQPAAVQSGSPTSSSELEWGTAPTADLATADPSPASEVMPSTALSDASTTLPNYSGLAP